jgi:hypothetical protein
VKLNEMLKNVIKYPRKEAGKKKKIGKYSEIRP